MIVKSPAATMAAAMDHRKHHYIDNYLVTISSKRGFVLGVAASFFLVSLIASTICPATASSSSASLFAWFFSVSGRLTFPSSKYSASSSSSSSYAGNPISPSSTLYTGVSASGSGNCTSVTETLERNYYRSDSDEMKKTQTLFGKIEAASATASSYVGNSISPSSSLGDNNATGQYNGVSASGSSGNGTSVTETLEGNYSSSDSDRGSVKIHQCSPVNLSSSNPVFGKKSVGANYTGKIDTRKRNESKDSAGEMGEVYVKKCDIYDGRWVRDVTKPHYQPGSCPFIDGDFDCFRNGRPDDEYLRWRWKPHGCDIPSLNATDFLERLKGKRILFVGDSLNRNMWESLVCILRNGIKDKSRVYEVSGRSKFKMQGYYSFRFEDYMCSVDFVRSPFLVKEQFLQNVNGSEDERLRLDLLDESTAAYHRADIVVFNTGHWWTHEKTSNGKYYYQEGNHVYPVLEVMKAYKKALITWAEWVDRNINSHKTQVVFRGYSLTHFRGGQWNSGGQCHKETEPIYNETFITKYPEKMKALEGILHKMETQVVYLNISRLTDYRKDGHPSIYRKKYNSTEEHIEAEKIQDCSHWCLPGVPDTWNELLYVSLLMQGKGSWKQ